ncbi:MULTISPECIES: hypothetical protein [unclassified Streptomyces]|uniref:hypothetical protein n=1 Tax=unclassified Streptomyces TaxID=2593676 RepID=UPI00068D5FA1|nr:MULTISPECIES: hypothetical protein [unclassified Streptomyces]QHF97572.1 hypothetical protein DEH18_31160 [Streptomyces sp. NHF165]
MSMRAFVAGHHAGNADEFLELAIGTPPELWLGVETETEQERAARLDAARDILADFPDLPDRAAQAAAEALECADLFNVTPLRRPSASRTTNGAKEVA